ncbi:MAG TPA: hypothetical protein DCG19_04110 [Cryomorphaceae bacterium]|nr:hypothetical protein [Owenweeksia sp.]MBF98854.1 hypothetical protein [Owenweeksia sp.]HAD96565.1 hypothetical protein [Cryomorphaceae bacterium]HBF20805.1 hypothetical protein [Cryomorphaceae bacterium]HCQ16222.1 hypothetical protein [Cryomorphaceae bacterium]|tara:strand:- start:11484 stop:12038 length:555 start_codon:yes stop_codon:yes gene_type:complete
MNNRTLALISLILVAMVTRFIPHAPNFTAVGAAAIMGGTLFRNSFKAFLIPVLALFISDLVLNNLVYSAYYDNFVWFTPGFALIYGGFILSVLIGRYMTNGFKVLPLAGAGILSAIVFYLLTNAGSWQASPIYSKDLNGLIQAYVAGLPFLLNQLAGTLVYGAILFGTAWFWIGQPKEITTAEA